MSQESHTSGTLDAGWLLLLAAWLLACASTLGSLFFSEVMELPPCSLCWYQRVFMFPLTLVLLVGLFPFDRRAARYGLPLAGAGSLVAVYHVLLQAGIVPERAAPCSQGVSCADVELVVLGFASIPLMSLAVFAVLTALLVAILRRPLR